MAKRDKLENLTPFEEGNDIAEKPFDKRQFEALCRIHCTEKEICDILGYKSHNTINAKCEKEYGKTFEQVYPEYASQGKASLRRMQWKSAEEGSNTMLIWLGKQHLGQSDKQELKTENKTELINNIVYNDEVLDLVDKIIDTIEK